VFGDRVARDIKAKVAASEPRGLAPYSAPHAVPAEADTQAIDELRRVMTAKVGVIRDAASLTGALATIAGLEAGAGSDRRLANMLTSAKLIAAAALLRKESRGAHFRSDYPKADPSQAARSVLTLSEADRIAAEALERRGRVARRAKLSA
jgi:L-aspartate oxidase